MQVKDAVLLRGSVHPAVEGRKVVAKGAATGRLPVRIRTQTGGAQS